MPLNPFHSRINSPRAPLASPIKRQLGLSVLLLSLGAFSATSALAQAFPTKPLRLVVTFPSGGAPDILARLFSEKAQLGFPVVVDNRPGAGGNIGADNVAKSVGDGHTLLLTPNTMVISPHVLAAGAGGGVDVHKDLVPVSDLNSSPDTCTEVPMPGEPKLSLLGLAFM